MFLNFQNFSLCFLKLILYIQTLIHRNLDFLVKSAIVVGVLVVSTLMLQTFLSKSRSYFWTNEDGNNTKVSCNCDPVDSAAT